MRRDVVEQDAGRRRDAVREANELVVKDLAPVLGVHLIRCECAQTMCSVSLSVHEDDYRAGRDRAGAYIVALDHVDPAADRVVMHFDGVCVTVDRPPRPMRETFVSSRGPRVHSAFD